MSTEETLENAERIRELIESPPTAVVARSRRSVWLERFKNGSILVACVALAVALWTKTEQAQQEGQAARASQVTACLEANRVRAQVAQLWDYIIVESRKNNPHPTAKQSADLANFENKVSDIYAPRKC